jgi:phosphoglycerol transferase MdoB-like AlkP superfamily enzyme
MNVNKYPPSLAYLCMTIGPAMIFLALIEHVRNRFTNVMNVFGRVPMLYYILHLYLIHLIGVVVFYVSGFTSKDISTPENPFLFKPNGLGFGLAGVYAVWLLTVVLLYPLCSKYNRYKSTHRKWWFGYI